MLQIQHLTIRHKKDLRVLLEDFALTLNPGDKAALIGEEGNGKSTLLQWLAAPECIAPYAEAEGQRVLTGERVGYLPQSLPQDQAQQTIYEFFCQEPMFWDYSPKELARQAAQLGLDPAIYYETRLLGSLSGGEKIKAQLLRLLLAQPTLLLLDEPSNDLDGETLRWLEEFLCRWEGTLLFVSHDETLLERVANKIIHLEQLRRKTSCQATTLAMGYGDYCAWREAQHERQGRIARSEQRAAAQQEEKLRRIQQKVEHQLGSISRQDPHGGYLLKKKMRAVKALEHRYEREQARRTSMPEREEEHQLGSISRQDPHGGYLLKKKMRAVKALEHRYEREQARRTSMPEREEAIQLFFRDVPPLPAGKLVLELELPRLMTPDGSRLLAQDIRLRVQGPRNDPGRQPPVGAGYPAACAGAPEDRSDRTKWSGQVHAAGLHPAGAGAAPRHPGGIPAPGQQRAAASGKDPGGVFGAQRTQRGNRGRPHPAGLPEIHPGGDGASGAALVWRAAQQAAAALADVQRGQCAAAGRADPQPLAADRAGGAGDAGSFSGGDPVRLPRPAVPGAGVYRRLSAGGRADPQPLAADRAGGAGDAGSFSGGDPVRLPRPAVPGAGVYRRLSAGVAGPAAAAAGTAAEPNTRRERS